MTAVIHSAVLSFPCFIFFSINVALAEIKEKKPFGFGKHSVGREYKIPNTSCQCASVLTYNISCSSRAGAVSGIASHDTFYGGFVLGTRMKPAD